jgi:hypothetical protein
LGAGLAACAALLLLLVELGGEVALPVVVCGFFNERAGAEFHAEVAALASVGIYDYMCHRCFQGLASRSSPARAGLNKVTTNATRVNPRRIKTRVKLIFSICIDMKNQLFKVSIK